MSKEFMDLSKISQRDYSSIYLTQNPFPTSLVPDEIPPFTADRKKEKEHFVSMMRDLVYDDKSSVTVFVGEYGSGKTHLLRALKHVVKQQLFNFEKGVFPAYVRTPGRNILDFYREFMEDVEGDNLKLFARQILIKYNAKNKDRIKKFIFKEEDFSNVEIVLQGTDSEVGTFIDSCMTDDLFKDIIRTDFEDLKSYDVINALLFMLHPTLSIYAWKWFLGLKLSKDELRYIHVKDNIDDVRVAYTALTSFLRILNLIQIKHVVLLVDELEKITKIPSNLRSNYQDDLRHLIDDFPSNMLMVFSISPFQWETLVDEGTALVRRLSDNEFRLDKFALKDVEDVIAQYLKFSRSDDFPKEKDIEGCRSSLYPFKDDALKEIFVSTNGLSNKVLRACRLLIEQSVKSKEKIITKEMVEKLLQQ